MDERAPLAALEFLLAIRFEKVDDKRGRPAEQRLTPSEPLLPCAAFTVSGQRPMHTTAQDTSPAAARTSARQNPLRSHPLLQTLTCASFVSFPQEQIAARFFRGEVADGVAQAHRTLLQLPHEARRLSRSPRRSSCVGRCGPPTRPRVEWSRLGSLAARSAARRPRLPPLLRPCLEWALAGPPGKRVGP